jgi:hypothetical protein
MEARFSNEQKQFLFGEVTTPFLVCQQRKYGPIQVFSFSYWRVAIFSEKGCVRKKFLWSGKENPSFTQKRPNFSKENASWALWE